MNVTAYRCRVCNQVFYADSPCAAPEKKQTLTIEERQRVKHGAALLAKDPKKWDKKQRSILEHIGRSRGVGPLARSGGEPGDRHRNQHDEPPPRTEWKDEFFNSGGEK